MDATRSLVLGGTAFIGRHLAEHLLDAIVSRAKARRVLGLRTALRLPSRPSANV